ncbi:MAG: hypothetical protein ACPG5U_01590 [Planktomarina sp.]
MKYMKLLAASALVVLSACATREPAPQLPEGAAREVFRYQSISFLRGVNGSHNTSPRGRSAALLDVTYGFTCLAGGNPSAKSRSKAAFALVEEKYTVAPLYFNNPREKGAWSRSVSETVFDKTGCVGGVKFETTTTDQVEVLKWALMNRVPPVRR